MTTKEHQTINNKTEIGFVNIHIDIETKQMFISNKPYSTFEEAENGIIHSIGIQKVGCFKIEYIL
jgi:hypothetical protein